MFIFWCYIWGKGCDLTWTEGGRHLFRWLWDSNLQACDKLKEKKWRLVSYYYLNRLCLFMDWNLNIKWFINMLGHDEWPEQLLINLWICTRVMDKQKDLTSAGVLTMMIILLSSLSNHLLSPCALWEGRSHLERDHNHQSGNYSYIRSIRRTLGLTCRF